MDRSASARYNRRRAPRDNPAFELNPRCRHDHRDCYRGTHGRKFDRKLHLYTRVDFDSSNILSIVIKSRASKGLESPASICRKYPAYLQRKLTLDCTCQHTTYEIALQRE